MRERRALKLRGHSRDFKRFSSRAFFQALGEIDLPVLFDIFGAAKTHSLKTVAFHPHQQFKQRALDVWEKPPQAT